MKDWPPDWHNWISVVGVILLIVFTIVFVVLVIVAVVWSFQLVIGIVGGFIEHRRDEANRVTVMVPGLGEFTSTDNLSWSGDVEGLQILLDTSGGPPNQGHAEQVRVILADLPRLVELCRSYLQEHEDWEWLEGGVELFEPEALSLEDTSQFALAFGHPADSDGSYRVEIREGVPVDCLRDD